MKILNTEKRREVESAINSLYGDFVAPATIPIEWWIKSLTIAVKTRDKAAFPQERIDELTKKYPDLLTNGRYETNYRCRVDEDECDENYDHIRYDYTEMVLDNVFAPENLAPDEDDDPKWANYC
jgi:hypothetical protein